LTTYEAVAVPQAKPKESRLKAWLTALWWWPALWLVAFTEAAGSDPAKLSHGDGFDA
jgi:hypothetical protein